MEKECALKGEKRVSIILKDKQQKKQKSLKIIKNGGGWRKKEKEPNRKKGDSSKGIMYNRMVFCIDDANDATW